MRTLNEFLTQFPKPLITRLPWSLAQQQGVSVWVVRLDQIHDGWSGNKWFKLFGHLSSPDCLSLFRSSDDHASTHNPDSVNTDQPILASFGGGYSNHLHALACLGDRLTLPTLGVVRGHYPELTPTLRDCRDWGMTLLFASRDLWRLRQTPDRILPQLLTQLNDPTISAPFYWIPEGGAGQPGISGCRLIAQYLVEWYRERMPNQGGGISAAALPVYLACGTGTTAAGLISGLDNRFQVVGVSVLKGEDQLTPAIEQALVADPHQATCDWRIDTGFHGGGYAKVSQTLAEFVLQFESETGLPLDPVYTAKVFWALSEHLKQGFWRAGSTVVVVHTGGLQGRRGYGWSC